jgi:hypothetical protein
MTDTENTQLTPAEGYNPKERMIFSAPIAGEIPDSKPKIEFKRINITTLNEDGSEGELIIPTERLYSFGVSENTSQETGKITGYTFPLCLWSRDGATREEKTWTDTFNAIVDCCIDHLVENREEVDMFELTRGDMTKSKGGLNPLYWKKEKFKDEKSGKMVLRKVPGRGPTLYAKLIYSKKNDKFLTQFFDLNDEPIEARTLMGKHCYTNGAVKIESIFIGARISLQVKLYEAVVEPTKMGMKRLLAPRPKARSKVLAAKSESKTAASVMDDNDGDNSDAGSLVGSDGEEDAPSSSVGSRNTGTSIKSSPKKAVVRRVKRVAKKTV